SITESSRSSVINLASPPAKGVRISRARPSTRIGVPYSPSGQLMSREEVRRAEAGRRGGAWPEGLFGGGGKSLAMVRLVMAVELVLDGLLLAARAADPYCSASIWP